MRCWRGMETITWPHRVKYEEALQTVREERNIPHTMKWWKAKWTGHTLRMNCFLKHVTEVKKERKIEEKGRQGRRRKQLLDERNKQIRHFGSVKNTLKVMKCDDGGGWRRLPGPIVWNMKKHYKQSRRKGTSYIQSNYGRLTGRVIPCVWTAF